MTARDGCGNSGLSKAITTGFTHFPTRSPKSSPLQRSRSATHDVFLPSCLFRHLSCFLSLVSSCFLFCVDGRGVPIPFVPHCASISVLLQVQSYHDGHSCCWPNLVSIPIEDTMLPETFWERCFEGIGRACIVTHANIIKLPIPFLFCCLRSQASRFATCARLQ